MMKVRPNWLLRTFYQEECAANIAGKPEEVQYYVVTNPALFREDFLRLMDEKIDLAVKHEVSVGERGQQKKVIAKTEANTQKEIVLEAIEAKDDIVAMEPLTTRSRRKVDLIKIPITAPHLAKYSVFEDQNSPILIFRTSPGKDAETGWGRLMESDLIFLTEKGKRYQSKGRCSITQLKNLFVEGVDGNGLTTARKMLLPGKNENVLALQSLRMTLEQALRKYAEFSFLKRGEKPQDPEKRRGYLGFARSLGLISESDAMQAYFVMDLANPAIHQEYMDIQGLTARIALHWVSEFVGKTIGYHWLDKFKENGTIFAPEFSFTLDQDEHRMRRTIHDQLQAVTEYRLKGIRTKDFVYLPGEQGKGPTRLTKEETMSACLTLTQELQRTIRNLTRTEQTFFDTIRVFGNRTELDSVSGTQVPIYTAQDAIRACMFVDGILMHSKGIEAEILTNRMTEYDLRDNQITLGIRRMGTGETRFKKYGLQSIVSRFPKESALITSVSKGTSYDLLTHKKD